MRPLDDPKPRRPGVLIKRGALAQKLPIPQPPLLPQRRTLLLPNKAVKLALNALEPAALALGKLPIKTLPHLLPLLTEIHAVVPDKVHLLFLVLWARRPTAVCAVGGGARGDGVVPLARVIRVWAGVRRVRGPVGQEHVVVSVLLLLRVHAGAAAGGGVRGGGRCSGTGVVVALESPVPVSIWTGTGWEAGGMCVAAVRRRCHRRVPGA